MNNQHTIINVGLSAYGLSGRVFHAPLLSAHTGFRLKKILDRRGKGHAKENYPDVEIVHDYADLLKDDTIDVIVVNTPEYTHYELGKQALNAGKHVIVEKAFTVTSQEGQSLIDLAKDKGKVLSVFQNSRWHGDFITIQKIIENQLLGRLVEFEVHYDRYRNEVQKDNWKEEAKPGSGSLYNLGSHLIDQALLLFGFPRAVWADLRTQRQGGEICDYFEVILYYSDLKVTLKSSYLVREPGPRYVLHGTEGSFVKYGADTQESLLKTGTSPLDESYGHDPRHQWGKVNTQIDGLHYEGNIETSRGSYMGFYDNIYTVLTENGQLDVKPEEAMATIRIIEAAIKSDLEERIVSF